MMERTPADKDRAYAALCGLLRGEADVLEVLEWTQPEWDAFASLAVKEGVAPLVCSSFRWATWPAGMPDSTRRALVRSYHANVAHNTFLFSELDRLLAEFSSAGIQVVVLKGAALADMLYEDRALRPMNDLDVLVSIDQLDVAMDVMRRCGYQIQKAGYHLVYSGGPMGRVTLELHWSLTGISLPTHTEFYRGIQERAVNWGRPDESGVRALSLCPEDQLLYLAAHLRLQHPGEHSRLIWYYDLHLLVEKCGDGLDWSGMLKRRAPQAWMQGLFRTLQGAQERLGTSLPEWFMTELSAADKIHRQPADGMRRVELNRQGRVWEALGELGWKLRLRVVYNLLAPHPTYMRWRYKPRPAWLWPACYPLRWWLLLRDELARRVTEF
jgi:hypothetical protein